MATFIGFMRVLATADENTHKKWDAEVYRKHWPSWNPAPKSMLFYVATIWEFRGKYYYIQLFFSYISWILR